MNKTGATIDKTEKQLLVSTPDLMQMLGCGRASAVEIGKAARAEVRQGRRLLWNVHKIERYIDSVSD